MEKLLTILSELRPDVDFTKEEKIIDNSVLDSFDIVALVAGLNEAFGIDIGVDDLIPENFNSISAIKKLIDRLSE